MNGMKKNTASPDPVGAIPMWSPCFQPNNTHDPVFKNHVYPHFSPNTEIHCLNLDGAGWYEMGQDDMSQAGVCLTCLEP